MVTETRTTIRNDNGIVTKERTAEDTNQAALWIVLAVLAFAGLGYAFYHYSNPSMTSSSSTSQAVPATNDNGTMLNNDTPSTVSQPTPTATPDSTPNSSSTAQ